MNKLKLNPKQQRQTNHWLNLLLHFVAQKHLFLLTLSLRKLQNSILKYLSFIIKNPVQPETFVLLFLSKLPIAKTWSANIFPEKFLLAKISSQKIISFLKISCQKNYFLLHCSCTTVNFAFWKHMSYNKSETTDVVQQMFRESPQVAQPSWTLVATKL